MELRQLKTFVTTAKLLSFTKAANALGYAQSTITNQIQTLEAELGTMLFERLNKQIKLTNDGEQLYIYASQILKLTAEAKNQLTSSPLARSSLTIGTAESLCTHRLPEVFQTYRTRYPNVKINLRFDTYNDYQAHLRKNTIDILLFLGVTCSETDLINHVLFEEPMAVVAAPGHPLTEKDQVTPHDISGQALILTGAGCNYRQLFESMLTQAGVKPSSILEVSSIEVIKKFICDGWGISLLPLVAVHQEIAADQLIALPWTGPAFDIKAQLIYHKDKWISPALQAFIDVIFEKLKNS